MLGVYRSQWHPDSGQSGNLKVRVGKGGTAGIEQEEVKSRTPETKRFAAAVVWKSGRKRPPLMTPVKS